MKTSRTILTFIIFICIIFSCKKNSILTISCLSENYNYLFVKKIKVSSEDSFHIINNIFNRNPKKFWSAANSNNTGEIIELEFSNNYFVSGILLESLIKNEYCKAEKIRLFTDNNYFGEFKTDKEIIINDTVKTILIQIIEVDKSYYINTFIDSINHKFQNVNLNKPVSLNEIKVKKSENEFYKIIVQKNNSTSKKIIYKNNFLTNIQNVDLSDESSYFILNSKNEIYCSVEKNDTNILITGECSKSKISSENTILTFKGSVIKYSEKSSNWNEISSEIKISENKIIIDNLTELFYKIPDSAFVRVTDLDTNILLDFRYATENNFTKTVLYDCEECLLRYPVALALAEISKYSVEQGYKIKLFDCYRPLSVQYKMWEVMPNINYVANPEKGSIHNRGGAVDITFTDLSGNEIDMGTEYDFFGIQSFHSYENLPDSILSNRLLLKTTMEKFNFKAIKTEWWHYSHSSCLQFQISDFQLPCKN